MAADPTALKWSAQLSLSTSPRATRLPGDKIILPAAALEQLLASSASAQSAALGPAPAFNPWNSRQYESYRNDLEERQQSLPQPLTFRLVNPENERVVYAGIQEFSAEEDEILLSLLLQTALGLPRKAVSGLDEDEEMQDVVERSRITAHFQQLPKGSYVKLRPLEAGYDVEDWKALLEQYLRASFTTLTKGEVLEVPGETGLGQKAGAFRFLVDEFKPEGEAICVVDTDLEVDIEALNEEQARETVKMIADKYKNGTGSQGGSSKGGDLDIFREHTGQLLPGQYVDYQLPSWPRNQAIEILLTPDTVEDDVDLLVSPLSTRHRVRPRADNYVFADWKDLPTKSILIQPSNVELEDAEALYITVFGFKSPDQLDTGTSAAPRKYTLRVRAVSEDSVSKTNGTVAATLEVPPNEGDVRCKNCGQWVPQRTLMLHENFCLRNNVLCPQGCGQVFQKRSQAFENHWHCPHDTFFGNTPSSHSKHDTLYHPPEPLVCSRCSTTQTFSSIPLLSQHHVTTCPARIILCRFCHLAVPQEGDPDSPNPEAILSGLTAHELADGSRTTECHLCGKIIRMRDTQTHMSHHNLERKSRPRPRLCRNVNCGNTLDGATSAGSTRAGKETGNDIGLCAACFGPMYVSMYDPDGKALRRRVERRYLQQLMSGCGKTWCQNAYCRSGRQNAGLPEEGTTAKTALPLVKPFVDAVPADANAALHFCVDEASARRRLGAEMLEADERERMGGRSYDLPWCVAACEAESGALDKARTWLENWAPRRDEERL